MTPGYYHLRVVTEEGVSLPVVIGVDALPQRPMSPSVEPLPVALHGRVGGSATVEVTFTAKAGQKVMAEVEAHRLGSKLRPVVHLTSPKRLQVAWAWPTPALSGDALPSAVESGLVVNPVHLLDLAVFLPAMVLVGLLLVRRRPLGFSLAVPLYVWGAVMGTAVVAMVVSLVAHREAFEAPAVVIMGVAAAVKLAMSIKLLAAIRPAVPVASDLDVNRPDWPLVTTQ